MSDTERDVAALMAKGLAPSEIDRALRLPEGRAHEVVVQKWAEDKAKSGRRR